MPTCSLCGSSEDDELNFGEFLALKDINVHYFCLLFAPLLTTRGKEEEGIRGFLLEDIRKECRRVKFIYCTYCKKRGANLGCCIQTCPRAYHLKCAINNKVSLHFCGHFETFCHKHTKTKHDKTLKKDDTCGICQEKIKKSRRPIFAPCCKGSWFHHDCLQKSAMVAGVFAKCPLCNNKDLFRSSLQLMGIFFPEKDADWELDRTIFNGSARSPPKLCETCGNSSDLNYSEAPWLWKLCSVCGAGAVHTACFTEETGEEFTCNGCQSILNRPKDSVTPVTPNKPFNEPLSAFTSLATGKLRSSLNKLVVNKAKPPFAKKKFTPWFSDDEQLDDSDEEVDENIPAKRQRIN